MSVLLLTTSSLVASAVVALMISAFKFEVIVASLATRLVVSVARFVVSMLSASSLFVFSVTRFVVKIFSELVALVTSAFNADELPVEAAST